MKYCKRCNLTQSLKQKLFLSIAKVYDEFYVITNLGDKKNAHFWRLNLAKLGSNTLLRSIFLFTIRQSILCPAISLIYYPTALRRVQKMPKTSANITHYLYLYLHLYLYLIFLYFDSPYGLVKIRHNS